MRVTMESGERLRVNDDSDVTFRLLFLGGLVMVL